MSVIRSIVAIVVALILQSLLAKAVGVARLPVDLVLVTVVSIALLYGRVAGLLGGSLAGLAQDAMSGGVMGIGGLSASLSGFLAGFAGTQFIVTQSGPRFMLFLGASALRSAIFMGLYSLLGLRRFDQPFFDLALLALGNACVGVVLFWAIERRPGVSARWRTRGERRRKGRYR